MGKIALIIVYLLLKSCIFNIPSEDILEVNVGELNELNLNDFRGLNGSFFSVHLELNNKSSDTISFWTMTCSWQLNWMTNSKQMYVFNPGCNGNYAHVIKIPGGSTFSYEGILRIHGNPVPNDDFLYRLGFILINENELEPHPHETFLNALSNKRKSNKDIYWSNSFYIK